MRERVGQRVPRWKGVGWRTGRARMPGVAQGMRLNRLVQPLLAASGRGERAVRQRVKGFY